MKTIATFDVGDESAEAANLGIGVGRSHVPRLQRPPIPLQGGSPREIGAGHGRVIGRFTAPVGKQRRDKSQRLDFDTQARQIHLFFSQHFVDVFHPSSSGTECVMDSKQFRMEMDVCCFRLDYGDSNTQSAKPPSANAVTMPLPVIRDM
jgi:hypothetical protein